MADRVRAWCWLHIVRAYPCCPCPAPAPWCWRWQPVGLYGQSFAFVGYLPTEATQRTQRIKGAGELSRRHHQTQLVIENPYRGVVGCTAGPIAP